MSTSWRDAFLMQARSDNVVRTLLNDPAVEHSHRLHYLQMMAEKLAKGLQTPLESSDPPATTHYSLVRLLQVMKGWRRTRKRLGFRDAKSFRSFIDGLLPFAAEVESLAPSAAGLSKPNPEYPWIDANSRSIWAPCEFTFPGFNPRNRQMLKLTNLLEVLLRLD